MPQLDPAFSDLVNRMLGISPDIQGEAMGLMNPIGGLGSILSRKARGVGKNAPRAYRPEGFRSYAKEAKERFDPFTASNEQALDFAPKFERGTPAPPGMDIIERLRWYEQNPPRELPIQIPSRASPLNIIDESTQRILGPRSAPVLDYTMSDTLPGAGRVFGEDAGDRRLYEMLYDLLRGGMRTN